MQSLLLLLLPWFVVVYADVGATGWHSSLACSHPYTCCLGSLHNNRLHSEDSRGQKTDLWAAPPSSEESAENDESM